MSVLALLFPGQGAQAVGMGKAFYDRFDESREVFKRANARLGYDLTALCFEGPSEELTKTERCQPALFVTSLAAYAAWVARHRERPVAAAGLSLGELTALTAAEALTFTDALCLVQARAAAMAECAARHPGTMLAVIGLAAEAIAEICQQSGAVAANFNAADQVVLSGTVPAIDEAEQLANARGAKRAMRLDVAGAFHSPLMQDASDTFRQALAGVTIAPPRFPVISNVTAQPVAEPEQARQILAKQIVSPVRWESSVQWMVQHGAGVFVEFPPARVLTGLLRRINSSVKGVAVDEPADFEKVPVLTPS